MDADPALIAELVLANHILFRQGVVDGFGHVSARHDCDAGRFLLARSMAPALVAAADIMTFDLDSTAIDDGRTPYLERFIHGEIYRARPDVMAVVHSHSSAVIPFGVSTATLRPVSHMGGFLGEGAPVFEIRDAAGPASDMLIRDRALGAALARSLGGAAVALMRGHGAVAVGASIRHAVFRAIYTEVNARIAADALRLGPVTWLTPQEAANVAAANDGQLGRAWDLWARDAGAARERG
jgi:HCOMODA/2-hydroxy-3-carboxy-muconic semialdehyde decarboxylase